MRKVQKSEKVEKRIMGKLFAPPGDDWEDDGYQKDIVLVRVMDDGGTDKFNRKDVLRAMGYNTDFVDGIRQIETHCGFVFFYLPKSYGGQVNHQATFFRRITNQGRGSDLYGRVLVVRRELDGFRDYDDDDFKFTNRFTDIDQKFSFTFFFWGEDAMGQWCGGEEFDHYPKRVAEHMSKVSDRLSEEIKARRKKLKAEKLALEKDA